MLTMELNISRFSFLSNVIEHYGSIYLQEPSERKLYTSASNGPSARSVVDLQNISTEWRAYSSFMWGISKDPLKKALSLGTLRKVKSHDHTIVS